MTDPLRDLLGAQVEEPRRRLPWRWLLAGILLLGAAIWFVMQAGGSDVTPSDSVAAASTSTIGATGPSLVDNPGTVLPEPDVVLDEPRVVHGQHGSEPEFDTSGLGGEQVLAPIDGIGVEVRTSLEHQRGLDVTDRVAVGAVDGRAQLFAVAGTIDDPYLSSYGAPGFCHLLSTGTDLVGGCLAYDPPGEPSALFVGSVGIDYLAWGLLGEDVSVAVLTVNDVAVAWQRPRSSSVVFSYTPQTGDKISLALLSSDGDEIGRSDRSRAIEPSGGYVDPISGYGDFSDVPFDDIDSMLVDALIVECMNDEGFAAVQLSLQDTVGPETIGLFDIPEREWPAANLTHARCRAGLNLPDKPPPSPDEIRAEYDALVDVHLCLSNLGFSIDPAPEFDEWGGTSSETRWDPILILLMSNPQGADDALQSCLDGQ